MHDLVGAAAAVAAALRASGGSGNWTGEWVGRRVGGFMSWPAVLGCPWRVAAHSGDRRWVAPRVGDCLKTARYCSFDSVKMISLTAKIDSD